MRQSSILLYVGTYHRELRAPTCLLTKFRVVPVAASSLAGVSLSLEREREQDPEAFGRLSTTLVLYVSL
jgi:hypothetical protein